MKVKIIKTGKVETYNDGYAARLVEQGKAIPVPEAQKSEKKAAEKPADKAAAAK